MSFKSTTPTTTDLEKQSHPEVSTLSWNNLTFSVPGKIEPIIQNVSGELVSGELLAVMGPSGAGKSTFLDALCQRVSNATGTILLDGTANFKTSSNFSFVEQDDALFGVLTVRETVAYAAYLSLPRNTPGIEEHIDQTIKALGLQDVAGNRIGTPLQRGISGGQKRRVTIACSMVARPRVLVCDEPTSGLDATSAKEVIAAIKHLAVSTNTICIATIHQPNYETFSIFDKLLLLAHGKVMYNGSANGLNDYLISIGHPTPQHESPSDYAINLVNTEFFNSDNIEGLTADQHLNKLNDLWLERDPTHGAWITDSEVVHSSGVQDKGVSRSLHKTGILIHRNYLNYARNILGFGIRMGMYAAMGFLLATIWINLGTSSTKIQDRLSVYFFSVAFLGFMSVSGIPSFLEERSVFIRERANGLYSPGMWVVANTVTVVPFLFACTFLFTVICYFAIGLHPGATAFFRFLIYLFLGVMAAESQSMLIAAAVPIFVAALALASFLNGFWMCVQGYFISAESLPRFWYYSFHFIDYQTFAFELLTRNDMSGLEFQCPIIDSVCSCPFPSTIATATNCALSGDDVIANLGYTGVNDGLYAGILIIIIVVYRFAMWGVLEWRKR